MPQISRPAPMGLGMRSYKGELWVGPGTLSLCSPWALILHHGWISLSSLPPPPTPPSWKHELSSGCCQPGVTSHSQPVPPSCPFPTLYPEGSLVQTAAPSLETLVAFCPSQDRLLAMSDSRLPNPCPISTALSHPRRYRHP